MNSFDVRIIESIKMGRNLSQDRTTHEEYSSDLTSNKQKIDEKRSSWRVDDTDIITELSKIRRIKMEKLHSCAQKIQRWWRRLQGKKVLNYYSKMIFKKPPVNRPQKSANLIQPADNSFVNYPEQI